MSSTGISLPLRIGWGIGSLGSATLLNTVTILVLFFMVSVLGIEPALAGLLIFAGKVYDMVTDPLMGVISDRTTGRRGRRRPWLLLGGLLSAASLLMLFWPTGLEDQALIAWMVAALLVYATGYTVFNVPYLAMPAEMTTDPHERSRLMSFRVVFASVGMLVGGAAAPALVQLFGGGAAGYAGMAWVVGGIVLAAMLACFAFTGQARFTARTQVTLGVAEQLRLAAGNRPFVVLILSKLLQLIGVASVMSSLLFLVTLILGRGEASLGLFGIASTLGTIASMPAWLAASRRIGKRYTYMLAILIHVPTVLSWLLATADESTGAFLVRALFSGIAAGGVLLMAQSMLPDAIEHDFRRTGLRREGAFAAVYSFVEKTAFAFGPLLVGGLLSAMGFDREAGAAQSEEALLAIRIAAAGIPALAGALSALVLVAYRLDERAEPVLAAPPIAAPAGPGKPR